MNSKSKKVFQELKKLTQDNQIQFKLYNHDGLAYSVFEHKICCEIGKTEEEAIKRVLCRSGMLKKGSFEGFYPDREFFSNNYGDYYYDNWENVQDCYECYQNLGLFLKNNLDNLTFYRYTLWIHEHIYIIGQAQSHDWLGLKLYSTYRDNP